MRNLRYDDVQSLPEETFARLTEGIDDYEPIEAETLRIMERFLDLREGVFSVEAGWTFQTSQCECEHRLTAYDFLVTAVVDAGHDRSFLVHALLGTRRVYNPELHQVRCTSCGRRQAASSDRQVMQTGYGMSNYACGGREDDDFHA